MMLRDIPEEGIDFIYLDGAHDYKNVKLELPLYYRKLRPGGVLAGLIATMERTHSDAKVVVVSLAVANTRNTVSAKASRKKSLAIKLVSYLQSMNG